MSKHWGVLATGLGLAVAAAAPAGANPLAAATAHAQGYYYRCPADPPGAVWEDYDQCTAFCMSTSGHGCLETVPGGDDPGAGGGSGGDPGGPGGGGTITSEAAEDAA